MANQQTNQTANQQLKDQLDSYKSRVSKSRKRKRIAYIAGLCLVAVAIVGLVLPAATLEYGKTYCGQEEHTHTDACVNRTIVCTLPDTSNGNGHVHVPSCYDEQGNLACGKTAVAHMHLPSCVNAQGTALVCGQEETVHMHTLACVDEATNTYKCGSEGLAHVHGVTCYSLQDGSYVLVCKEPSVGHVHTLLCLDPETDEPACGLEEAIELSHVHTDACYDEELICGMEEHVHNELCYDEITEAIMKKDEESSAAKEAAEEAEGVEPGVAEGDLTEEEIAEARDQGLLFENDDVIVTFSVPEKYAEDIQLVVTETDEEVEFVEAVDATEEVNVEGEPVDDEAAQDGDNGEPVFFSEDGEETDGEGTDEATESDDAVDSANETLVAEPAVEEEPAYQINLHIEATLGGEPVEDISKLGMTAKLQMKPRVIAPILNEINYAEVAPEIKDEVGAEITVLQQPENAPDATISQIQAEQVDQVVVTSVQEAATSFDVVAAVFTARANNTPNAKFTVKYLAPVVVPALSNSGTLSVIDTAKRDSKGNLTSSGNGSNMPTNTKTPATQKLSLNSNGTVKTTDKEVDIYAAETFKYYKSPTLDHFNKVYKNTNYKLEKIRVKKGNTLVGEYAYDKNTTHFTNRPESAGKHDGLTFILIEDGCTIELVFKLEPGSETIKGSFYDYDITDGKIYSTQDNAASSTNGKNTSTQGTGTWYANTNQKGINSSGNYSGSGTKLGFGNINAGSGLGHLKWGSNQLNMYNWSANAYMGCTFGLVTGLSGDKIQYASGVQAPKLFNEGGATGKETYDNSALTFSRIGDTYILSSTLVDGKTTSNLGVFKNPQSKYPNIWTNNFWPVDNTRSHGTNNHDMTFGSSANYKNRNFTGADSVKYTGAKGSADSLKSGTLPQGDDGKDHNSFFGMHYTVKFNLTKDYVGPLEYLFFGDDDLWIFLDGKLVVDIGGVHSSVGEYVNLWDHIKKGTEGEHTLSVFYTERGASGSTCYMNFTLPSVSSSTIEQDTGAVTILKNVSAAKGSKELEKEFNFSIKLTDGKGNKLANDYSYTRFDKNGNEIDSNLIVWDGGSFSLKNGEYVTINYLPVGATYKIQEVFGTGENPPYNIDWEYYEKAKDAEEKLVSTDSGGALGKLPKEFEGTIGTTTTEYRLEYTNTVPPELPATGGVGTYWYWIGGGALIVLALLMLWRRQTLATATASSTFTKTEASVLAFFGDTQHASPSGKPESVYSKGWSRASKGDESTRKGGRY